MAGLQAAAGNGTADTPPAVTPEIAAEAAVWVARLHGPDRSRRMERECLEWQARSAMHREAFERCTETWQDVPHVSLASAYATASARPEDKTEARDAKRPAPVRWAAALAVALLVIGGAALFQKWRVVGEYNTGVGEQQLVVLDDGTRMSLNTATHVRVSMESAQRTVSVDSGEAMFEVARDARRPFVVRVAGAEVVALDTVFAVRFTTEGARADDGLAVTLISGQATVRAASGGPAHGLAPERTLVMQSGERVHLVMAATGIAQVPPRIDRPNIERIVAWKRSEAVFDDASLADAVAEMNRYSRTPIVLFDGPALAGLRVSGLYRTGDNAGFARAVAALHRLRVSEREGRLELARAQ